MATKSIEWRPGPTVCRCCLAEGCYKDISTEYFWMGKREVYAEMLSETFSVSIAYSTAGGPNSNSRLICEPCISRLRDASDFKRQVQECEKTFMQHLDPGNTSCNEVEATMDAIDDVKLEVVKQERRLSDDDEFDDRHDLGANDDDDDDDDLDDQPLTRFATKVPKKESVDLLDMLDNSKATEKRKSTTKVKAAPAKKSKKDTPKATSSKPKPEKKKKGDQPTTTCTMTEDRSQPVETRVTNDNKIEFSNKIIIKVEKIDSEEIPIEYDAEPRKEESDSVKSKKRDKKRDVADKNKDVSDKKSIRDVSPNEASRRSAIALIINTTLCPFRYDRSYMCNYCPESYVKISDLEMHTNMAHGSLNENEIRKLLSKKAKTHLIKMNAVTFGCKLCHKELDGFEDLKNHLVWKHQVELDVRNDGVMLFRITDDKCRCAFCSEEYNSYSKLIYHVTEHYSQFHCEECGTGFVTADRLKSHMRVHINGAYPCTICGKMYTTESRYQSHYRAIHLRKTRSICNYCPEIFKGFYHKTKHMALVHGIKKKIYQCGYCPKSFKLKSSLKSHEELKHVKLDTYKCDVCDFASSYKRSLESHMICHSGKKFYKCEICGKAYVRKYTHEVHMRIHNDDRRFACQYCGKAFVHKSSLRLHLRTYHKDVGDNEMETSLSSFISSNLAMDNSESSVLPESDVLPESTGMLPF